MNRTAPEAEQRSPLKNEDGRWKLTALGPTPLEF
jgi:hypothetical protein